MIKAIIFDFDGTIVDSFPIVLLNANKVLEEFKLQKKDFTPEYVEELRGKSARQLVKDFGVSIFKLPKFVKKAKEFIKDELQNAEVFKGMKEVLAELSKHFIVGILTTNDEFVVKSILDKEGINSINFIYSDSSLFGKHRKLKKILKKYNLKKDEAVYVGDEVRDIQASNKAGIVSIAVTWGFNSRAALSKETRNFVSSPQQLLFKLTSSKEITARKEVA